MQFKCTISIFTLLLDLHLLVLIHFIVFFVILEPQLPFGEQSVSVFIADANSRFLNMHMQWASFKFY